MGAWQRFLATAAIWAGTTTIIVTLFAMQSAQSLRPFSEPMLFALVVVIIAGAVSATRAVWQAVREIAAQEKAASTAKAKRSHRNRIERLIESLDDEDIYDLETLLQNREQSRRM
jgi:hypothetical protein